MTLFSMFINKCLSLLRLGRSWFSRLIAGIVEAGRTISYVETVNPKQSDTLHKEVKWCDIQLFKKEFENAVRKGIKAMRLGIVKVAIDVTEEPYWGKEGKHNTRTKVHERSDESWQYINLSIVDPKFIPLMSLPYRQIDDLDNLVMDLLEYLRALPIRVNLVLFDRGFYHWKLIDYLENRRGGRPWPYLILVPKNDAMKVFISQTEGKLGVFRHEGEHLKDKSGWRPTTKIVICKGIGKDKKGEPIDWCFSTNQRATLKLVRIYRKRWNIETGFRIQDEAKIKSKSSNPLIRFFYHLLSMLIILMWRLYNYFEHYLVFKRYLKCLEQKYLVNGKPPPIKIIG